MLIGAQRLLERVQDKRNLYIMWLSKMHTLLVREIVAWSTSLEDSREPPWPSCPRASIAFTSLAKTLSCVACQSPPDSCS